MMKKVNKKGFTLAELLIVVAINNSANVKPFLFSFIFLCIIISLNYFYDATSALQVPFAAHVNLTFIVPAVSFLSNFLLKFSVIENGS